MSNPKYVEPKYILTVQAFRQTDSVHMRLKSYVGKHLTDSEGGSDFEGVAHCFTELATAN